MNYAPTPIQLLASMVQDGRGGIGTYVRNIADNLRNSDDIELTVACNDSDTQLFAGHRHKLLSSVFSRGICDFIRCQLTARAPTKGILHVPSYRRVPWFRRGPVVATVHDLAPLHMPEKYGWLRYQFIKRVVPVGLKRCAHIFTVTQHTADDLHQQFGIPHSKITVAPCGIDHERFCPGDRDSAFARCQAQWPELQREFVLYTSRIEHPGKGHLALLKAWDKLGPQAPQLVFAGAACERADEVFAFAQQHNINPLTLGFVPDELLPELYRCCTLFVFPSLYEGFGLPPVEAMACGAPVACSRAAALAETAGPAAELDPTRPEQMATVITDLLSNADAREHLRQQGQAWAQQFSWERSASIIRSVYMRLCPGS